jgi:hypothetical protein
MLDVSLFAVCPPAGVAMTMWVTLSLLGFTYDCCGGHRVVFASAAAFCFVAASGLPPESVPFPAETWCREASTWERYYSEVVMDLGGAALTCDCQVGPTLQAANIQPCRPSEAQLARQQSK